MRAAGSPTPGLDGGGAKWRREVPPPRRLTAREQYLPWAVLSFPSRCRRVNHSAPAAGTLALTVACSRAVNAGSCPTSHRHVTVARTAKKPHDAGDVGMPVNATEPPPTASNIVAISPGVIATGHSNRCLSPNPCLRHPKSSQSLPWSMRSRPPLPHRRLPSPPTARASAQPQF